MKRWLLALALLVSAAVAGAAEIHGVAFPDKAKIGDSELGLNGAGVRAKLFFKVYAAGLYLPEKRHSADEVLGLKGAKHLHIVTLMDLTAPQFADALVEGLHKNLPEAEIGPLQPRIDQFRSTILALKSAPKGTAIDIDWLPSAGTRLSFNGEKRGDDISGEDFYRALLRIWLGEHPAEGSLKEALLGR
ncbi:MAG TPA: chalcone isomerase family protein [Rhodocyclaceae bacterium]